jgi:hypothetical protein
VKTQAAIRGLSGAARPAYVFGSVSICTETHTGDPYLTENSAGLRMAPVIDTDGRSGVSTAAEIVALPGWS